LFKLNYNKYNTYNKTSGIAFNLFGKYNHNPVPHNLGAQPIKPNGVKKKEEEAKYSPFAQVRF